MMRSLLDELRRDCAHPLDDYMARRITGRQLVEASGHALQRSSAFRQAVQQATSQDVMVGEWFCAAVHARVLNMHGSPGRA